MAESLRDLLHDPDPTRRKQAVMRLARSSDPRAGKILAHMRDNDSAAEIRGLAGQALAYIQQQTRVEPPPLPPEPTPKPGVSPDDILQALDLPDTDTQAEKPITPLPPLKRPITQKTPASRTRRGVYARNLFVFGLFCALLGAGLLYITVGDVIRRAYYANEINDRIDSAEPFPFGAAPVALRLDGTFYAGRVSNQMSYYIQEPSGLAPAAGWPLIVGVHGSGGTGRDALNWIGYEARSAGAIVVMPTFSQNPDASYPYASSARDLNVLLTELERYYPIDQRAKIIFGFSAGGMFASSYTAEFRYFTGASIGGAREFTLPPLSSPVHFVVVCGEYDSRLSANQQFYIDMVSRGTPLWHYEVVDGADHVMTAAQIDATFDLLDYLTSG